MSDQCGFPDFQEALAAEGDIWKDVLTNRYGLGESLKEAGLAAGFAALWPEIAGLNKVLGCPPGTSSAPPSHLDMNAHPVAGIDRHR
jgi:hypothetical protein